MNNTKKNILLVSPETPVTFWSFKHVLKFVRRKAAFPPLGLLTIASLLPRHWDKRLIDMDVEKLKEKDLQWADYVFLGGMIVHKESIHAILKRCKEAQRSVIAGGPVFTTGYEEFIDMVDHFVLDEAEITLPLFLKDLQEGVPKKIYTSGERPHLGLTPIPSWDLINIKKYATMSLQYSRGCPFNCEFCDIIIMNGRVPRLKSNQQMIAELDALYQTGWRGAVFVVDDNFIGNKNQVKQFLPALSQWMRQKRNPFVFLTEASVNLADDDELIKLMVDAGFKKVFVGIESPCLESLEECSKFQNQNVDLAQAIRRIQNSGLEVMGGFIVGFDSDPLDIFEKQIAFIQKSGIVVAMVGILGALPKTKLYNRLKSEGRLLENWKGNNADGQGLNFVPKMNSAVLKEGYEKILTTIYSPKNYFNRIITFIKEYKPQQSLFDAHKSFSHIMAFIRSLWYLGVVWKHRFYYWKILAVGLCKYRQSFPMIVLLSIYGYHFSKLTDNLFLNSKSSK